jgi:hypothetical protein
MAGGLSVASPVGAAAEAFSSYWSTLSDPERAFVDRVASGIYSEEKGKRASAYSDLNVASKARLRAKAVEILGVENRPARAKKKGKDI